MATAPAAAFLRAFVFLSCLLFALGMVVRAHSQVIGTLIALAGAGNLVGILANFERLALIGELAAAYPHWLSRWMWLPGVTGILPILSSAFGAPAEISLALFSIHLPVSVVVLCIGLALWARGRGKLSGH